MNEYQDVLAALVEESHRDCLQLVEIECAVLNGIPHLDPARVRQHVLALVRDLILDHGLLAGEFRRATAGSGEEDLGPAPESIEARIRWTLRQKSEFVPWGMPIKCTLDRIDFEWAALGRESSLPDVVWLVRTKRV